MEETVYPLGKNRHVWICAGRVWGNPCVKGTRIPTECLFGMFCAGESIKFIAFWYEIPAECVHDAVQYESMRRQRHGRKAIKKATETETEETKWPSPYLREPVTVSA